MIVPPPKYNVDRLVPCRTGSSTTVEDLFLIERGEDRLSDVAPQQAVEELMENTADAYGFPPFQYLAPVIVLGDGDYADLQRRERAVLASAVSRMRLRRIASNSFGWADTVPALLADDRRADHPEAAKAVRPAVRVRPPSPRVAPEGGAAPLRAAD
jgi:dolichol-phosphate mannosyltransferase